MDEASKTLLVLGFVLPVLIVPLVAAIGAVVLAGGVVVSFFGLIPKLYFAYRDKHAFTTWPAMLFYAVAPTSVVVLGASLAWRMQAHTFMPDIEAAVAASSSNIWIMVLGAFVGVLVVAMVVSAFGMYIWSFSWAHQAYTDRGFSNKTLLLLLMLFGQALLVPPTLMFAIGS